MLPMPISLLITEEQAKKQANQIMQIEQLASDLPLDLRIVIIPKQTGKYLKEYQHTLQTQILLFEKNQLFIYHQGMKVGASWHQLQRRIVTAGRKSELLLQACKLQAGMIAIDTTAGFGHDSLILASTGAKVIMLEENPMMVLLLQSEKLRLLQDKNWQGLLARLQIKHAQSQTYLQHLITDFKEKSHFGCMSDCQSINVTQIDLIYIDPMFPENSYADVKVNKNMQLLHELVSPPSLVQEQEWLNLAKQVVKIGQSTSKVVVKRPYHAKAFANEPPSKSWQNNVIRFDGYL